MRHGGNSVVPPTDWGMTIAQFLQFVSACQKVSNWSELRDLGDKRNRAGHVTAYQINTSYVKPFSSKTGSSVSLLLNQEPLAATVMISHGLVLAKLLGFAEVADRACEQVGGRHGASVPDV